MTGLHADPRHPRTTRRSGVEPPGYDRAVAALRRSARILSAVGLLALAAGLGLVTAALVLEPAGGLGAPVFIAAGSFLVAVSLLPLVLGRGRRHRIAFLARLRARWVQLARAGDPNDQIAPLARAYAGLIRNDLRARVGTLP